MGFKIRFGVLKYYTEEDGITEVRVPAKVKTIGEKAGKKHNMERACISLLARFPKIVVAFVLRHLLHPQNTRRYAFAKCTGIQSIYIPDSVKTIGVGSFMSCTNLTNIRLPAGLRMIERHTFCDCRSLKTIELPPKIRRIGDGAFAGCSALEDITIPENVRDVGWGTFQRCTSLKKIILPEYLWFLGSDVFRECTALEEIALPDNITELHHYAFLGCSSLRTVRLSKNLEKLCGDTFQGCVKLHDFDISPEHPQFKVADGILYTRDGTELVRCPTGRTVVSIPESVEKIGEEAFAYCENLSSIFIPDSVRKLGYNAFFGCSALKSVRLPENIHDIPFGTFRNCTSLKNIELPASASYIGTSVFAGCTALESITLPDELAMISRGTFADCLKLRTFRLASGNGICADLSAYDLSSHNGDAKQFFEDDLEAIFRWMNTGITSPAFEQASGGLKYPFALLKYRRDHDKASEMLVRSHTDEIIRACIRYGDTEQVSQLLQINGSITAEHLEEYISLALESNQNRIWAILADYKNKTFGFESDELL